MFDAQDHRFMARALRLAAQGLFSTSPNPRVGCVLVKDGHIVGEGWHQKAGGPHAEVHALRAAGEAARGATAYVTLEPCSHFGRTPPCADALIQAGVARVVAAMEDPNPLVSGQGLARIGAVGIATAAGLLAEQARELNIGFIARMTRGRPWLRLKGAASLDGRTALANGASQWITGPAARQDGHRWRARACAILTGSGTVLADDPQLTVRGVATERQPLRVVVDSRLVIPGNARILEGGGTLVVTACEDGAKARPLQDQGAEVLVLPGADGRVDLSGLLAELGRRGLNEVHGEGGARLHGALIAQGLADELLWYLAPCLIGGGGRGLLDWPDLESLEAAPCWRFHDLRQVGTDLRILARRA